MDIDEEDEKLDAEEAEARYPWLFAAKGADAQTTSGPVVRKPPPLSPPGRPFEFSPVTDRDLSWLYNGFRPNLFLAQRANTFVSLGDGVVPASRRLFSEFWLEGEIAVLFGETGSGKSLLAMQIASALAGGPHIEPFAMDVEPGRVVYFDFELSSKQFAERYAPAVPGAASGGEEGPFPSTLVRCAARPVEYLPEGFKDVYEYLLTCITDTVEELGAKTLVIDNVSWLTAGLENSSAARRLMKTLIYLKNVMGRSVLVLAHTPKHFARRPISVGDLQGSAMLANLADSIIAIGTSRRGRAFRYLKGIKHRSMAARDPGTEVASLRITKADGLLGFAFEGFTDERAHIGWAHREASSARPEFARRVRQLHERKCTQREIAEELGVSASTVNRCLKAELGGDPLEDL